MDMNEWIDILKCPLTQDRLRWIDRQELANRQSDFLRPASEGATNGDEHLPFEEALISHNGQVLYPIIDGIPVLLQEAAMHHRSSFVNTTTIGKEKQKVRNFYNSHGWMSSDVGGYEDAAIYEDLRQVSSSYIAKCHERVRRHLPASGKYLLDAACGAIQFPAYLSYSQNFEYRVCVDFSFLALKEARKKLGEKGIYILCDITKMPLRDNVMDGFISLHTIYHIPAAEQVQAVEELHRVLALKGKGIIVYDWFKHSLWMNVALFPFRVFVFLKNRLSSALKNASGGRLYFHAHPYDFLKKNLPPFRLYVWRSVSVPFLKYYIHRALFGEAFLRWLYRCEEKHPQTCGRYGEYPMMVFEKD